MHGKFSYPLSYLPAPEYVRFDFKDRSGSPRYVWSRDPTKTQLSVHALTWGGWASGSQAGRLWAIAPRGKGSRQVKLPREK